MPFLVIRMGLEPMTYCLEGSCSIQLSYQTEPIVLFCGCKGRYFFANTQIFGLKSELFLFPVEFLDQIRPPDTSQALLDSAALLGLVPEEVLPLGELLALVLGREDGLQRVGVVARVPGLGGDGHRRRRKVLHLLQMEVELPGDDGELGHVGLLTAGVRGDEVGDDLLPQVLLGVDAVEDALEVVELLERRFAHQPQHAVAGVLGRHLQPSADVMADQLAGVLLCGAVGGLVLAAVQQQVVAYAAADEALLDAGQGVDGAVDVEQLAVVGVEVRADLRMDAAGALAFLAEVLVAPAHTVHVRRRPAEVGEIALEVGHVDHLPYLAEDALLRPACDELALMC